ESCPLRFAQGDSLLTSYRSPLTAFYFLSVTPTTLAANSVKRVAKLRTNHPTNPRSTTAHSTPSAATRGSLAAPAGVRDALAPDILTWANASRLRSRSHSSSGRLRISAVTEGSSGNASSALVGGR